MKTLIFVILSVVFYWSGCAHNPNKAEKINTNLEKSQSVSADDRVGVKDGNLVVQKKVLMGEQLRVLQNDVYELEDRVYGNRKFGSKGLYGVLKDCRTQLSDPKNGGDGKLKWIEPIERITDKEQPYEVGIDEKDQVVAVSEEFLKDRIARFQGYKAVLQKREDEYQEKIDICKAELKEKKHKSEVK